MSEFKEKCGDVLTGGSVGAAAGGSIGAAIGLFGGPVTSAVGAKIGGAVGVIAAILWEQEVKWMWSKCFGCPIRSLCLLVDGRMCGQKRRKTVKYKKNIEMFLVINKMIKNMQIQIKHFGCAYFFA